MKCTELLSNKQFLREFHYSRFWLTSSDWRSLVYIPWLPYKWQYQMFHVIYRWIIVFYFIGWLTASGVQFSFHGGRYLIFLTNWSIIGFVLYLLLAALSVTLKFLSVHVCAKPKNTTDRSSDYDFKKPQGCCGHRNNQLSWYQMIHWSSFGVFGESALAISILYWALLYQGMPIDGVDANTHLVNGIVLLADVFFFGVPVNILHVIYPLSYATLYGSFTGIYFAANGTNPVNEQPYIYPIIDYSDNPGFSALIVVLVVLLYFPLIHLLLYTVHLIRFWLVYALYGQSLVSCWGRKTLQDHETIEQIMEEKV